MSGFLCSKTVLKQIKSQFAQDISFLKQMIINHLQCTPLQGAGATKRNPQNALSPKN